MIQVVFAFPDARIWVIECVRTLLIWLLRHWAFWNTAVQVLLTAAEMVHSLQKWSIRCRNGPSAASLEQMKPALIDAYKRPTQGQQSSQREPNPFRREMLLCSYLLQVEAFPPGQRSEAHGTRNV